MEKIHLQPSSLRNFGDSRDSTFCLVTNPEFRDLFQIAADAKYADSKIVVYDQKRPFEELLAKEIPQNAHVLVVMPDTYFKSPDPEFLTETRKLSVLACSSTPTSTAALKHFIKIAESTDPADQDAFSDRFFELGESVEYFRFVDERYQTEAVFHHMEDDLAWHEQTGVLGWGQQQLLPSGEISVLPVQVFGQDIDCKFKLNGQLAFKGWPILHSGTPSFLLADQERIYRTLTTMQEHAVIATLEDGIITHLEPTHPSCRPAAEMLDAMRFIDSRFGILLEIGFGINTSLELFAGNSAMNEVYGGDHGVIHWGLGLIPYTQYHLDIISPGTKVYGKNGERIFGF